MSLSLILSAILLGLMGAGHCAVMCGPTTIALVTRTTHKPKQPLAAHLGRIVTYSLLGAVMAFSSREISLLLRARYLQAAWLILPNFLLLLTAIYLMGFDFAYAPIEGLGKRFWRFIEPLRSWVLKQGGITGDFLRGSVWGMLPCGLIYSALSLAALTSTPFDGALIMFAFGASTVPILLALGLVSSRAIGYFKSPKTRLFMGFLLLTTIGWNLYLLPSRLNGVSHSFFC